MELRISESNPTFTAINAKSVENILRKKRLIGLVTGRMEEYRELKASQVGNPYDIVLTKGMFKSLKAQIVSKEGNTVWKYNESIFDGIMNSNPNKFIEKLCIMADYFNENSAKAKQWININLTKDKKYRKNEKRI